MDRNKVIDIINSRYNENRKIHTKGVIKVIEEIAIAHGIDREKAFIAAAFHDYSKATIKQSDEITLFERLNFDYSQYNEAMYHGFASAFLLRDELNYDDEDVFQAIYDHVSGNEKMTNLAKILYIADTCEPNRQHGMVDTIFNAAIKDIDSGLRLAVKMKSDYTINKGKSLDSKTIKLMKELGVE